MAVMRIVANLTAADPQVARLFYERLLGLDIAMDFGWILTFASEGSARPQISIISEGGSGTEVPNVSVEVDNVDEIYGRAQSLGFEIVYPLSDEPWGVRRFFVRDPLGMVINILSHKS